MENNQQIINLILSYCKGKPGAYEARPFGESPICFKVMGKIFAQLCPEKNFYKLTVKCEPEKGLVYRHLYPGVVVRGHHSPPVQQPYWNTIDLYAFEDMDILLGMIDEGYEAVIKKLKKSDRHSLTEVSQLTFQDTDGEDEDFAMLCGHLDLQLDELVGTAFQRSQYSQYNLRDSIHDVIVAYRGNEAVGCGAFKLYDDERAELKRVFVEKSCQGIGLGAELVRRLEAKAKMAGYKWFILETGAPLKAACHLYNKLGYKVIENYGQYAGMENSICMQKKL